MVLLTSQKQGGGLSWLNEKKEFPLEEDYGVQLNVVGYNLECSLFYFILYGSALESFSNK